jgi:ABC-type nitrate/sulfonate/bicarbonate transport system substrate-binding protein
MTIDRRSFVRGSLAAALAGGVGIPLLAGCGSDGSSATADTTDGTAAAGTPPTPVRMTAMMPFPLYLAYIAPVTAVSAGYMTANGVDLDLQFARSAPQAVQQLAAGNVSLVQAAPMQVIQGNLSEGADLVCIGMTNQQVLYTLVSTPEASVDDLEELVGKTVGMATLGGNAEQTFDLALKGAGIDPAEVGRQAVGNEASALALAEEGVVDAIFSTREAAASMEAADLDVHIADIDANPLLGTAIVTRRAVVEDERAQLVGYLAAMKEGMDTVADTAAFTELVPEIRTQWDLPQLDDLDAALPVVEAITTNWFAAGADNLLVNVPERWEEGVEQFAELKIVPAGTDPTQFYTNDLLEEALS